MNSEPSKPSDETPAGSKAPTLWQTIGSVAAAFFGVQNRANRERDFQHGKPVAFIVAGLLGTLGFILFLLLMVKIVMRQAGAG